MSYEYFARPETLWAPSMREIRLRIRLRFSASGHLYSGIVSSFRHLHHCRTNTHVGATAAEVAAQPGSQLFARWMRMLIEESLASNHEAGRAEAALLRVIINERLLHRM